MKNIYHSIIILIGMMSLSMMAYGSEQHIGKPHWSYTGSEGPASWGNLSNDYRTCKSGVNQSPINITAPTSSRLFKLEFDYRSVPLQILNNGHTIQFNYSDISLNDEHFITIDNKRYPMPSATQHNSILLVSGEPYSLLQVHFHSPSEHAVDGIRYPLEAHFVHMNKQNQLAVVSVLFKNGQENPFISRVWQHMPTSTQAATLINGVNVNVNDLLSNKRGYYHYRGSLTTPPCSEGVRWFVMKEKLEISKQQVAAFLQVINKNARPLQPINQRYLLTAN